MIDVIDHNDGVIRDDPAEQYDIDISRVVSDDQRVKATLSQKFFKNKKCNENRA